jgi:hypothetical protein
MKKLMIGGALVLAALGASAQTTPAKQALVQKVVQLQMPGIEAFARTLMVEQPLSQLTQAAGQALQQQPADKRESLGKAIDADIKKYADEVDPIAKKKAAEIGPKALGNVLDEKMTEDELKTLVAWLESPVSKKYGQIQPDLQRSLAEALVTDSRPVVEPKLKALQASVGNRLGIKPPTDAAPAPASGAKAPAKK